MRKIVVFVLTLLAAAVMPLCAHALADGADSACVMNAVTGEVIFEKNADEKKPMASTTKIMTLIIALENSNPDDVVTVAPEAVSEEGSSAYLEAGAQITMRDLCYGLMLNSGNDAAVAIAYHLYGSGEVFAFEMNNKAKEIGAADTCFKNPNGLDEEGHCTTARDLARIAQYGLKNEQFREIVSTRIYNASYIRPDGTVFELQYINHNRLLGEMTGCIGVKTGYTKADGRCLVSACDNDGKVYIAVTLNDPDDWADHKAMMEMAYSDSRWLTAVKAGDCIKHLKSDVNECDLVAENDFYIPVNGVRGRNIDIEVNVPNTVVAPLNAGEKVGELEIYIDGVFLGKVNVIASNDYDWILKTRTKNSFWFHLITILRNVLG